MSREELFLDSRIIRTKRLLKGSLLSLLEQKKFNDITITNIVSYANLNRGSFYNHFQDKEALLDELIDNVMSDLIDVYRKPYLDNKPFIISNLSPSSVKLFHKVYEYSNFFTIILESDVSFTLRERLYNEFKQINIRELRVYDNKINSELIASYLAFAISGLIIDWVHNGFKYTPDYMADQLLELMKIAPKQTFRTKV